MLQKVKFAMSFDPGWDLMVVFEEFWNGKHVFTHLVFKHTGRKVSCEEMMPISAPLKEILAYLQTHVTDDDCWFSSKAGKMGPGRGLNTTFRILT